MSSAGAARDQVRAIAQRYGTKPRQTNLVVPGLDGGPFDLACRLSLRGRRVEVSANGRWLSCKAPAQTSLLFAAGWPDAIFPVDQPAGAIDGVPLFVSASLDVRPALRRWLAEPEHRRAWRELEIRGQDRLLVARNGVNFAFLPSGEPGGGRLEAIVRIAECLPPEGADTDESVDDARLDPLRLPAELRSLVPFIRRWAIGDDVERCELMTAASDAELEELIAAVRPHLPAIDRLFAAHVEPLPDEILLVGRLAEAALEAEELRRRT